VILISKIYDSVTDPFEGVISDRTRTKLGRRRPYLLAGIPLVFLSFFAMFYPVSFESETSRFLFVIATYLFFSTIVSIVMLNYSALQAELTLDYNERTSLATFRIFFSTISSILCALLPLEIVKAFPDVHTGWIVTAIAFGLLFALPFIATVAVTRERPEFQKELRPFHWKQAFIEPFQVRTFVYVLIMYVTAFTAFDATQSIVVYYIKTYLGRGSDVSFVLGGMLIAQVISLPFFQWLSKRTSKARTYIVLLIPFYTQLASRRALHLRDPGWHWLWRRRHYDLFNLPGYPRCG
jgi:Na+/melibiose symporter-like transporter